MSDLLRNSLQYADAEQQALAQQRELEEAQNAWAPIKGFRATRIGMDVNANNMDLAAARAGGRTEQATQLAAENAQLQQRQGMHAPGIERVEDIGTKNGYLRDGLEWFGTQAGSGVASMAEPMAMAAGGALLSRVPGLRTAAPVAGGLGALAFNQRQIGGSHYGRIAEDEQAMANLGDQGAYQQANAVGALGGAAATAAPWIAGRAMGGAALGRAGAAMIGGNFLGKTAFTAGTEGLSEVVEGEVGRTAHTMANPYRDKSGDNSERLNEGLSGIAGGTLPGAAGAAVDTMALGANRTGEAVKDAAGSVRDLAAEQGARATEAAKSAADKANLKQVFDLGMEKGKSVWETVSEAGAKAKDFMTGEDGRADYVGAFNKAQAEYERFKMDQEERDLLTAVLPEDIADPAEKQAWVDDITQRKDDYLYRKMSELEAQGMEEAGSFLDGLESGDPVVRQTAIEQASEFLLERNSAAELQRQIAANQRLMGEGIAKAAGLATRAARKTGEGAMFAGRAAMKGVADELANKKNKQGTYASLSEPLTYSAWRQIQGDPVVEEMGHAIKRAAEGRRVADATDLDLNILRRRQASQSRAQLFGEIMAAEAEAEASRQEARRGLASRVQTERSVTNPDGSRNIDGLANYARTLAYEISDMAESWAGHERTRDTVRAGTALNVLDAMAKDVRLTLRQSAAPVIQRLSEQADPATKPFFDALLERVQRPVSPQAERAARQSVTDQMVALLPQEFQQELLRDGGTEMLFETVGAISRGRVTAGKRREIEEALGTDTVNKLVMAYNGEFATDAGGNPLGETYVDDGLQVMGEGELNDAGEANYVSDDGEYDANGAMGGEISAWERSMKEKTAEMGSGPKIYGLNNDPKARTSPFEPSDKPSKEAVDQYRRDERQRHINMQQPMVRMPQKRPNLFQDEGYDEQGNPIEHRGFKARAAQMEKTLGPDYSIDKRTALEVMDDRKIPTEDRLALYRDYMQAEMLKKDEGGNLSEEDRANYEQMIDFISSGMEKARRNPEMWASALRNPRVAMTEEQKRGSGLVKERGNDPDAKMRETLITDMEDYFRSRYMAVAERRIDRDPTSPEAMEVRELTDKARKAVSSIRKNGEDITKANIIWFDTDKRDKNGNVTRVPVRADDLVSWYRKAKAKGEEYSAPDDYSNRTRNESFLEDLSGALAAFVNVPQIKESTVGGPYMEAVGTDGKIRKHQFSKGAPPTLQLETSSYSDYQYGRKNNRRLTPGLGTDAAEMKRMAEVERESRKQNTPAFGDGGWKDAPMQEADASNEGTLNPFGDIMAKFTAEQSKTEYTKATERAEDRAIVKAKADEARKQEAAEARKIADDYKALRESLIAERLGNAEQSPATGHLQARAQAQNDARRALPSTEVSPDRRAAIEAGVKSSAVAAAAAEKRGAPLTGEALRNQRKHAVAEKARTRAADERRGGPVTSADPDVLSLKATSIARNKQDDQVNRKLYREVMLDAVGVENGPERRAAERFAASLITDIDRDTERTISEKIDLEVRSGGGHKVTAGLGRITKLNAERLSKDHAALMMTKFWHIGDPNDAAGREASFNRGLQGVTNRLRVALAPEYNPDTGVVGGIHYVWPLTHLLTAKMMGDRSKLTPAQSKTLVTARSAVAHAIASHPKLDVAVKMRMLKNMYPEDQRARITTANYMTILDTEAKTYRALLIERAAKANAAEAAAAKTTAAPEVAAAEAPKSQSNPGGGRDLGTLPMHYKMPPHGVRQDLRAQYPNGTTTAQLMADGHRTATTRRAFGAVGDTFTVAGREYRITALEQVDMDSAAGREKWAQREGWDVDYIQQHGSGQVRTGAVQTVFERVGAPKSQASPAKRGGVADIWAGVGGDQKWRGLSNLAPRKLTIKGRDYISVEHAYQSLKSGEFDQDTYDKYTKAWVKIPGTKGTKKQGGWNVRLMERIMRASFEQNPEAMALLRSTGGAVLTHDKDKGIWKTEFPRILTEIRDGRPNSTPGNTGGAQVTVQEYPVSGYRDRTKHNADAAGATVAVAADFTTAGERLTKNLAADKYTAFDIREDPEMAGKQLAAFMANKGTTTLNVAGNGIYTLTKYGWSQEQVNRHVYNLLAAAHAERPITKIVSGGQTGVDIAGAIAARVLGIPAEITLPKGYLQRNAAGVDQRIGKAAVEQQIEQGAASLSSRGDQGGSSGRKFNKQGTAGQSLARETLSDLSSLKDAMNSLGFRSSPKEFSSVAEKLLVSPDEDVDLFLKQSARGLSYLLMEGETGERIKQMLDGDYWEPLRVKVVAKLRGMGLMRGEALVATYREITRMALAKEIQDRNIAARTFVGRVTQMAKDVLSKVRRLTNTEQFQDLVRNSLNELVARNAGPIDLKANYRKVVFQDAVDADPQSARVLASVSRLPGAMLTGSIVLATYGPMYRDAANMLHDLDVLVPNRAAAQRFLVKEFPNAVQVYDFKTGGVKIDTYIVPPPGTEVQNIVREYGDKGRVQGYEVVRNGKVVGKMWNDKEGEHKSGEAATLVDLMSEHKGKAVKLVPFKVGGKAHHITVAGADHIFGQKLGMLRPKDIGDYRRFVPDVGRKFNKQGAGKPESEQIVDGMVDRMREYYPDMTDGELRQMAIDNLNAIGETNELGRQYQAALAAEAGQQDGMTDETSPETPADGLEGPPEPPQATGEGQGTPKAPRKPRKKGAGGRKKPGHELVAQDDPPAPTPEQTTAIALRVAESRATDEDIQKARDYVKRVLGDQVRADFEEITGYSGEWIEAEDVIKISTLTNAGILNVTRHEALHAFFSKFIANNPKAVDVFRSLTDDPRIISRLEFLLKDEPSALEQLADGEERLAYIYQFAMAGQLKLPYSPGKTLMEKVRKFLRRVFMMVRNDERAIDLLYAFERGEFNTPSAGTRALARHMDQGTWMSKGARAIDGFSQWTAAAVLPAATILQNSASPTARKLTKIMVTNPGEDGAAAKGHGYLNDRNMRMRQYNNLFRGAIDGLDAGQMAELVEVMQRETPDDAVTDPDVLKARQHLRVLFDRFHKYMTKEKGVRLGRIKENYFPVVWDANKLRENPEGFKGMLLGKYRGEIEKIVASLEEARQKWISRAKTPEDRVLRETTLPVSAEAYVDSIYDSIIGNEGVDDAMARSPKRQDGVLRPWMSAAEKRLLDFIQPEDRAPFMEKDLIHIVTRYVRQGVRTAEYTSRFGRTGARLARALQTIEKELNEAGDKMVAAGDLKDKDREKWVKRQYRDVANAVGAMEGSLGNDVSDTVRKINSWAIVYQNVRVLPLALFSSFVDPLGIVVRGGEMRDAWSAFTRGIKSVVGQWGDMLRDEAKPKQKDHWEKLAELAGVIDSATFSHLLADEYASVYLDGRAKKINEFMFKANGMEAWNRSMRISATKTAVKFMEAHNKGEGVHSKRWMRDLGFEPGQLPLDVDGNLITNKRVMMSQFPHISEDTAEAVVEKVHKAINRWVEGAILSPNASQRPAWGSDPRFSMFWHLKQFAYSFHETILKRAVGEAKQGNVMPLGVLAWYIPSMIVADVVKGMAVNGGSLPDYMKSYDMSDWMMHGIDRSGVLGAGNVALDGVQDPWGIAGPAVEQIADSFTNPLQQNIVNAMPANALYKGALI